MDRTVSISKGVFVFNRPKQQQKRSKNEAQANVFTNQLWYNSYNKLWTSLNRKLQDLSNDMFADMLTDLVYFVKTAYDSNVTEIPTAALLTGINMPDHAMQFTTLAKVVKEQISPHVVCLYAQDCSNIKYLVENMVYMFVNDVSTNITDDLSEDEDDKRKIKKINCNFSLLQSWYEGKYKTNVPSSREQRAKCGFKPLVVIIPDFESFNERSLQDFILIASSYLNVLPFVLVFGIATSLTILHKCLPYHASSKINVQVFSSQPSTVYLNNVLEKVFFTEDCVFHLGGKVFGLFTDIFLFYDLSVTGFVRNLKYAMIEHFSQGNAISLCSDLKNCHEIVEEFTHDDFESVRKLLSFRNFVEKSPPAEQIKLLTDDVFFKNKLLEEMENFHKYLYNFHAFLYVLYILCKDLPKSPLGKQVRELYAIATSKEITSTSGYKETFQLLSFQSKTELSAKVTKIADFSEKKLRKKSKLSKDFNIFLIHLNVYVNNLEAVAENETEEVLVDTPNVGCSFQGKMDRQKLKNKLLENSKKLKPMNKYEKFRSNLLMFLDETFQKYLREPKSKCFHEIFFFDDVSVQNHVVGAHRAAIHSALTDPHYYLLCECCKLSNDEILRTMPDICIAYKLHLECGKMINLYDWLQAFLSVLDPIEAEDDDKRPVDPELQARFTQAVAELEYLGFVKSSKRKTDHVTRLTWGG